MLKIAVPNKGSLSEVSLDLIKKAGYSCKRSGKELSVVDKKNEIEFIYLRPRDIAIYVSKGILELGITGRDLAIDSKSDVCELLGLGIGRSRFFYAAPKELDITPEDLQGKRIATSYPNVVLHDLAKRGISAEVVELDGAIEISIRLGVADAIADVVESGRTLTAAGLKTIGESIMESEAAVVAKDEKILENSHVRTFIDRLRGIIVAREYAIIEYDVPEDKLEKACEITPGIESPTVSPLSRQGWMAVKAMLPRKKINPSIDQLAELGAKGIIVTQIQTCRI
ncbi:ATP phosphoribosyltransferase [Sedimentisphaera cyanobacteriorum]|uniref:ATP phosphoribosyltransferase n=1 Tax=Sedimentisphaera cyanobacteriorum TaxID=1940790 RepID=A0A1Q2HQY0_9BACT|nr:ATP phosphoribosyltransferase [Sedimentisphaera cyanobacteriorum]AQQ09645.1 ATP phosphoribosyltransferase [Sedimentisphaera cyanobacteriorum]